MERDGTSQGTRKEKERTAGKRKKHDLGKKLVKVISRGDPSCCHQWSGHKAGSSLTSVPDSPPPPYTAEK
jgi:hypothetical protein